MQRVVNYVVPSPVLGDFVQEVTERGMIANVAATEDRDFQLVSVPYAKEDEDEVNELDEYLKDLISDLDKEEEEEEEEDQ